MAYLQHHLNVLGWPGWLYGGERVDATTNAPVSGGSFRYAYDGIGRPSDFIAWPES